MYSNIDVEIAAQNLVDYVFNMLSIQYDSDGKVMSRKNCLPKIRMIARSHVSFLISQGRFSPENPIEYWIAIREEIDNRY
jgi:hypothetical protein